VVLDLAKSNLLVPVLEAMEWVKVVVVVEASEALKEAMAKVVVEVSRVARAKAIAKPASSRSMGRSWL
jgi:hypothetical protein